VIGKHVHGATTVPQPLVAFQRFQEGVTRGKAPAPITIGRLIQSLGRLGELDKVGEAYTVAQTVLQSLELNKKWQSESWFMIEDSMIIALAHAGDVDSAHVHRARILEQGGAPTADAYGALILYVKDTTDDTSNAMALFQESQMQGVQPNQYLYNNIISKLAKARKADYALELFQQMKANRIPPSSITYGAVIGACARVGDVHSAEMLFAEMVQARNFRPRVPPYNTMMQLYTTTKPNRERSLFFYGALRQAGVSPTAHTYKVRLRSV
jgi:pentatricopeptide repeat protein